jgi:predicted RNA-binding protein with PIN domain
MIILIDAYNLIKQVIGQSFIEEDQRGRFIKEFKVYAKKKRHKLILVFDGGFQSFPVVEREDLVDIVYVGYGHSADDYIKDYLEKNNKRDMILVSSDLELKNKAKSLSVEAFDVFEFYGRLKESFEQKLLFKSTNTPFLKITEESNPELDELMMSELGDVPLKKDDFDFKIDKKKFKIESKKETKRDKILKKL